MIDSQSGDLLSTKEFQNERIMAMCKALFAENKQSIIIVGFQKDSENAQNNFKLTTKELM